MRAGLCGPRPHLSLLLLLAGCAGGDRPAAAGPLAAATTGRASWYGDELAGNRTASGERFDPTRITAAHRTLPLGSLAEVTDLATGRAVVVRINDRGPHARDRVIDLSHGAARLLGTDRRSVADVRVRAVATGQEGSVVAPGAAIMPGATAAAARSSPTGRYHVQIASFENRDRARALAERLDADVVPAGPVWRVRLGPYDAGRAQAARDAAAARGYADARLVAID